MCNISFLKIYFKGKKYNKYNKKKERERSIINNIIDKLINNYI